MLLQLCFFNALEQFDITSCRPACSRSEWNFNRNKMKRLMVPANSWRHTASGTEDSERPIKTSHLSVKGRLIYFYIFKLTKV